MKRWILLLAALCLALSGCGWMDGNFYSVTPHEAHTLSTGSDEVSASNYRELQTALEDMITAGREKRIIYVAEYDQTMVESGMAEAVRYICTAMPLGVYAVDDIRYELGSNGGIPAVAVEITYLHGRTEILQIRQVDDMDAARDAILEALTDCGSGIVLQVDDYEYLDIPQLVDDFAGDYPQLVMEIPEVAAGLYPESGESRILELKFTYQNSREDLRSMKSHVSSMFDAAALYVSSDDSDGVKLSQLYGFLMERFDYQIETSITPAYSLLRHGVGDSKAFAEVYAAMCRQAGLECRVVTGTRDGEPWYWNIVLSGERYFHVDLLRCSALGGFREFYDEDMDGYVWDYSAYPECLQPEETPERDNDKQPSGDTEEPTEEPSTEPPTELPTEPPTEPENTEPTEPSEETGSSEETEPTEPTGPSEPTEPGSGGSTEPAE